MLGWVVLVVMAGIAKAEAAPVPGKVDLVPEFQRLGLAPRAQGGRDTCSLFAITALADFECARNTPPPHVRFSEEFLIWAANEATGRTGDQAMFYEAVHGLNALGICAEELMPYEKTGDAARKPSAEALADAAGRSARWQIQWIRRWNVQRPMDDAELLAVKASLADGHPVACGLRWPISPRGHELLEVPLPTEVHDGHSIVFAGYEDDPKQSGGGTFVFRNWEGPNWGNQGYGVMSYAYARAYANDAVWLRLGPPKSEVPVERFEAESLDVPAKGRCETSVQDMGGPMWSGGKQLLCQAEKGGFVEVAFQVGKAGRYRLRVLATAAPDYGIVRAALDGKPLEGDFDLYSGRVSPAGSLELGTRNLAAGRHRLRFAAAGKNPASAGFAFGLDTIDLLPAGK
jgi:hypothetical protein